jgi:hypothetical protein
MNSTMNNIEHLNNQINCAHRAHYENSLTGLINTQDSPNKNLIYHLYNDGEITFQKGSWAYLQRSEYPLRSKLSYLYPGCESLFKFPNESDGRSYAILTERECIQFNNSIASCLSLKKKEAI